jgi:hypothetical protein
MVGIQARQDPADQRQTGKRGERSRQARAAKAVELPSESS